MSISDLFDRSKEIVKFKANQLKRMNRLRGEISNARFEIQATREKIASTVMGLHQQGALTHEELNNLCEAIDLLTSQIAEKQALIDTIRAEVAPPIHESRPENPCPHCNIDVPIEAAFCPNCGKEVSQSSM